MFKDFYEDIYYEMQDVNCKIFSKNIKGSVCYSLFGANKSHRGCFVISYEDYLFNREHNGISEFYIPINARDNREGLSLEDAKLLCDKIRALDKESLLYGEITSGCINENFPSREELENIWKELSNRVESLSIGGSFWLAKEELPYFISDIRIGEYMLFGSIPYSDKENLFGENAFIVKSKVIGVFHDRKNIIIDCGYSLADVKDCIISNDDLEYVDSSSEYTIFRTNRDYKIGDEVEIIPNYKSLIKLKDAERNYI